jgi:hypothetical protein
MKPLPKRSRAGLFATLTLRGHPHESASECRGLGALLRWPGRDKSAKGLAAADENSSNGCLRLKVHDEGPAFISK